MYVGAVILMPHFSAAPQEEFQQVNVRICLAYEGKGPTGLHGLAAQSRNPHEPQVEHASRRAKVMFVIAGSVHAPELSCGEVEPALEALFRWKLLSPEHPRGDTARHETPAYLCEPDTKRDRAQPSTLLSVIVIRLGSERLSLVVNNFVGFFFLMTDH
ncbi:hypothetical protein GCM10010411_14720 [Actinomadura fulvescens]|uniref:Uncharacterized protein n=1 Tax=Actinomadura fulvescens TaxID=46160 RepID=A0ABN3PFE3_9ACTN